MLNLLFPDYPILSIKTSERERVRERGGWERAREKEVTVPAFFLTLEFLPALTLVTRLRSKVQRKDRKISMFGNCNKI